MPVVSESLPLRRVAARTRLDFWFDAAILVGYTVAYSYGFTGVVIHEWLGIALGIALLLHITLHWDWVVRTTGRLLRSRGPDKLIWLVNLALLFAMTLCVASGILISRAAVRFLRQLAAVTALVAVVVLIGLAWHQFAPGSFGGQGGLGPHRFIRSQAATAVHRGVKVPAGVELNGGGTSGVPSIQLGDLLQPVNLAVMWNTAWIEAAVIAAVVIVDAGLRKWRRARRGPSR